MVWFTSRTHIQDAVLIYSLLLLECALKKKKKKKTSMSFRANVHIVPFHSTS